MANPALVLENIHTTRRTRLFWLLGIPVYATPLAWLNPALLFVSSLLLTFFLLPESALSDRLLNALALGLLGLSSLFTHSIGHIVSGKLAGAPMDYLLLTATRQITVYEGDQTQYAPWTHIIRALGGPLGNLVAALVGTLLTLLWGGNVLLLFWTLINTFGALGGLIPAESVDGGVLFKYMVRR